MRNLIVICFAYLLYFKTNFSTSDLDRRISFAPLPPANHFHFRKIGEDVRCGGGDPIQVLSTPTFGQCKEQCIKLEACLFVAFWKKISKCEIFEICETMEPPEKRKASIWLFARMTDCMLQTELTTEFPAGRYATMISSQFAEHVVKASPPNQNILCKCVAPKWMVCGIFLDPGSPSDQIVRTRLRRVQRLHQGLQGLDLSPITYHDPADTRPNSELVHAELMDLEPKYCIDINICHNFGNTGMYCPFNGRSFLAGDPVYILNTDMDSVFQGTSVPCFSVMGLRQYSMRLGSDGVVRSGEFKDILMRHPNEMLTVGNYSIFFIINQEQREDGACHIKIVPERPQDKAEPSDPTASFDMGQFEEAWKEAGEQVDETSSKKKKKKKKAKKASERIEDSASDLQVEQDAQETETTSTFSPTILPTSATSPDLSSKSILSLTETQRQRRKESRKKRIPADFLNDDNPFSESEIPRSERPARKQIISHDVGLQLSPPELAGQSPRAAPHLAEPFSDSVLVRPGRPQNHGTPQVGFPTLSTLHGAAMPLREPKPSERPPRKSSLQENHVQTALNLPGKSRYLHVFILVLLIFIMVPCFSKRTSSEENFYIEFNSI